jgi:hypothetical protein
MLCGITLYPHFRPLNLILIEGVLFPCVIQQNMSKWFCLWQFLYRKFIVYFTPCRNKRNKIWNFICIPIELNTVFFDFVLFNRERCGPTEMLMLIHNRSCIDINLSTMKYMTDMSYLVTNKQSLCWNFKKFIRTVGLAFNKV